MVNNVLLKQVNSNSLVQVDEMVLDFHHIMVLAVGQVSHFVNLHFKFVNLIVNVRLLLGPEGRVADCRCLFVDVLDRAFNVDACLNQQTESVVSFLIAFSVFLLQRCDFFVRCFHVLVDSLETFLFLLHAGLEVIFELLLLRKDRVVVYLLQ